MRNRRRSADGLEIRDVRENVPPVRKPEQRGQQVAPQFCEQLMVEDDEQRHADDDDQRDSREQPSHATKPEVLQVDGLRVVPFDEQKAGNKVAREHEENSDA